MRTKETVISGNLHINLNLPHISFHRDGQDRSLNNLTTDDLKSLLVDLGLMDRDQHWPRESQLSYPGNFPVKQS